MSAQQLGCKAEGSLPPRAKGAQADAGSPPLGIIAGLGQLPVEVLKTARALGRRVVVFDLAPAQVETEESSSRLAPLSREQSLREGAAYYPLAPGQMEEILRLCREEGVKELVMAGKVRKDLLYQGLELDSVLRCLLTSLPERTDAAILRALVEAFAAAGIQVSPQTTYLQHLLVPPGVLTRRAPTSQEEADIRYGLRLARAVAALDIGQLVVVKARTVLAVEAIEGSDAAIRRGARLGGGEVVVVKVAKHKQDLRFDLPTVGRETLKTMLAVGARVLAFEARTTFFLEREETLAQADAAQVTIVAV